MGGGLCPPLRSMNTRGSCDYTDGLALAPIITQVHWWKLRILHNKGAQYHLYQLSARSYVPAVCKIICTSCLQYHIYHISSWSEVPTICKIIHTAWCLQDRTTSYLQKSHELTICINWLQENIYHFSACSEVPTTSKIINTHLPIVCKITCSSC